MFTTKLNKISILAMVTTGIIAGCIFNNPITNEYKGVSISQDHSMIRICDTVEIYKEDNALLVKAAASHGSIVDSFSYSITNIARILPVTVGVLTLQANDIVIQGKNAVIASNYGGDIFAGALQVVDISSRSEPVIIEEWKFESIDINAVHLEGNTIIFGGAANPDVWGFKSCIGRVNLGEKNPESIVTSLVALPSHAVTGITHAGNRYYVSVGAENGKVVALDNDLNTVDTIDMADPRDVDAFASGICVLSGITDGGTTNGTVTTFTNDLVQTKKTDVGDFGSDYHKATIEMFSGQSALLGLSEAGAMVLDLAGPTVLFQKDNPSVISTLKPNTNSVSSDANLLFTANGNYGFRVFKIEGANFANTKLIGYVPFEGLTTDGINYSANHVEYKANYLFVASGVGGINVYVIE